MDRSAICFAALVAVIWLNVKLLSPDGGGDVPSSGLRAVILEEASERGSLSPGHALFSPKVAAALDAACESDAATRFAPSSPAWKRLDDDVPAAALAPQWQPIFDRALKSSRSRPWLRIERGGRSRFDGPFPVSESDALRVVAEAVR